VVPEVWHPLETQEELQLYGEYLEDVGQRVRGVYDRRDGHEAGDDEGDELPDGDAGGVELRDTLGVHQARTDLQTCQEGGGGPFAALVQELDQAHVGTDGHDQLGAALLGDEDGDVLREPRRGERLGVLNTRGLHPLHPWGFAAGVRSEEHTSE